jgi:hypothetical protein
VKTLLRLCKEQYDEHLSRPYGFRRPYVNQEIYRHLDHADKSTKGAEKECEWNKK